MFIVIGSVVVGLVLVALGLYVGQSSMIYHPRPYSETQLNHLPNGLQAIKRDNSIVGFYRAPPNDGTLQNLWLMFGGNADQALGWDDFTLTSAQPGVGFLLVEYPSFGAHEGKPTPESILSTTEQTITLLAKQLGLEVAELKKKCSALGHSLGAAAALQYAARNPVQRLVLISPFTTMLEMAKRTAGWPLCEMLTHRYDNQKRLQEIIQTGLPTTTVLHGGRDLFIPVQMGQTLAAMDQRITMVVITNGDHNDILQLGAGEIHQAMGIK